MNSQKIQKTLCSLWHQELLGFKILWENTHTSKAFPKLQHCLRPNIHHSPSLGWWYIPKEMESVVSLWTKKFVALAQFSCFDLLQALFGEKYHLYADVIYITQKVKLPGDFMMTLWTQAQVGWLPRREDTGRSIQKTSDNLHLSSGRRKPRTVGSSMEYFSSRQYFSKGRRTEKEVSCSWGPTEPEALNLNKICYTLSTWEVIWESVMVGRRYYLLI